MTYASALAAAPIHVVDATLLIDGIPVLFGTRPGLVHPVISGSEPSSVRNPPATLTSVAAIMPDSISLSGAKLDMEKMLVPPSGLSLSLFAHDDWNFYFHRRREVNRALVTDSPLTADNLTINVNSTSGWDDSQQVVYCERETIHYDALTGTTQLTGCTRRYCSLPMTRESSHVHGSMISGTPRYLLGRPAEFRLWLGGSESYVSRYVYLTSSPQYDATKGCWSFTFDDAMRLFDRKLYVGWKGSAVDAGQSSGGVVLSAAEGREFFNATNNGEVMVDLDDGTFAIAPITSIASTGNVFVEHDDWGATAPPATAVNGKMRRVYDLSDMGPLRSCLHAMLSDRGDAANHATYDSMPGISSSGNSATRRLEVAESELRFGAAIDASLVDVSGIEALDEPCEGWNCVIGASGAEESLLELLTNAALARGGYWYFNSSGKLAFRLFDAAYAGDTSDNTATTTHILRDTSLVAVDDESEIVHTLVTKCNFSRDGYQTDISAHYLAERETYRESKGSREIKRRCLLVGDVLGLDRSLLYVVASGGHFTTIDMVRLGLDRLFARASLGIRKYAIDLPWSFHRALPGERVQITHPNLIDFEGSTLDSDVFEIIEITPTYGSRVRAVVQDTWPGKRISPTAIIETGGWDAATNTITVKTNTKFGGGTTPGTYFAGNWRVRGIRSSGSPRTWTTAWTGTVSGATATTITLTVAPATAPAANDIIVQDTYQSADTETANAAQSADQHDYAFMSDTGLQLGSGPASQPHEWG